MNAHEAKRVSGGSFTLNEDERRLLALGYTQEVKRIFSQFTNFGLTASMISILLGIIPLYTYSLQTGGPSVMIWTWVVVGIMSFSIVASLAEISSVYPTMGALYYWAYRLGGEKWGGFASWMAGWTNLLGQIAGVASGGYAGADIIAEIIVLTSGQRVSNVQVLGLYALMLIVAGIVNTFAETMLTALCYVSCFWQIVGTLVIVVACLAKAPSLQSAEFVFASTNNSTGFDSSAYVVLAGCLAAASVFTGYDTAAHVAEETHQSHEATPKAMLYAVLNALVLGVLLIIGMNYCIPGNDVSSVLSNDDDGSGVKQAYTMIWLSAVGREATICFLSITLFAIECSNCANLTSAARMVFSFARDGALPFSQVLYHIDKARGGPTRAIWFSLVVAFLFGVPGVWNSSVLSALFSLTATGLYFSYIIPLGLRITVARDVFKQAEWNLGQHSLLLHTVGFFWGALMVIVLCLPSVSPVTMSNLNYSPLALGAVLVYAVLAWEFDAKRWFRGAVSNPLAEQQLRDSEQPKDFIPLAATAIVVVREGSTAHVGSSSSAAHTEL